ncbi:hypothetical protein CYMTET_22602 [Cymbomonas tetramitiformis]|uniref:Phosphatase tensin-type domain-containing protein n=1 Tax=Cymbomonas tetramitiformis TaxID=36881 RepID=A0AAE0FZU6_9CHLO|nr:hypothetical protein CYMTET_22602 [Cymbomonas tetramitiformis]
MLNPFQLWTTFLRSKRRPQTAGEESDLIYITENIIALTIPGDEGKSWFGSANTIYRSRMLEALMPVVSKHDTRWKMYEVSPVFVSEVCTENFSERVDVFPLGAPQVPPVTAINAFCKSAKRWLEDSSDNVVVVHCKAGRNLTGLMVCCLMLHLRYFSTITEAAKFYSTKHGLDHKILDLPSQARYCRCVQEIVLREQNGTMEAYKGKGFVIKELILRNCPTYLRPGMV